MFNIIKITICFFLSVIVQYSFSQTIVDYSTLSSSQCNTFSPAATVGGKIHTTTCGAVKYDNINKAIELDTKANNNIYYGTEYKIAFPFKQTYSYTIKINGWCNTPTFPVPNTQLRADFTSASNGSGTACNGPELINTTLNNAQQMNPGAYFDYTFQFNSLSQNQSFLYISSYLPYVNGVATSWALIKKVTIT